MKKRLTTWMMLAIFSASAVFMTACSEEKKPESMTVGTNAVTTDNALDSDLSESFDVAVYDLYGEYSAAKTIEAMNCDIAVNMTLNADGTYSYYRAPMNSSMTNDETGLEDAGTYEINGSEIVFTGENLGEFALTMTMDHESVVLSGKIPTGGPSTDMTLNRVQGE